ncbi:MAG TPA: NAD(P)-binding protein, partial [Polyangiales bacterium]
MHRQDENNPPVAAHFDAIVLGAGISGLVSASILNKQGAKRILVIDEYESIGGNHIDRTIGGYTFDIGSFIFQDDSPLLRHFPELLPGYVPITPTFGRVNPQRMVTKYPFSVQDDLLAAGPAEVARVLLSVAYARVMQRAQTDARTFARYWIGQRLLHRSGLENYMRRFYGVEPGEIDVGFAYKRMLWIKEHAQLSTHVRRFFKPLGPATNQQLARPRAGFAALYQPAVERLQ